MTRKDVYLTAAIAMTAALAFASDHTLSIDTLRAHAAKETLRDVEASARAAMSEAEGLRMEIQNPRTSATLEGQRLHDLKEEVNRMGKAVTALEAQAGDLPDWQQRAVAKIVPLLEDEAAAARAAIASFNKHPNTLWQPVNREYAERMARDSREIMAAVSNSLRTND